MQADAIGAAIRTAVNDTKTSKENLAGPLWRHPVTLSAYPLARSSITENELRMCGS